MKRFLSILLILFLLLTFVSCAEKKNDGSSNTTEQPHVEVEQATEPEKTVEPNPVETAPVQQETKVETKVEVQTVVVAPATGVVRGLVKVKDHDPMYCAIRITNRDTGVSYYKPTEQTGAFTFTLEPGNYTFMFERGAEYTKVSVDFTLKKNVLKQLGVIELEQVTDLYSQGWIAGDLHQHTYYSDGRGSVSEQLLGNISRGIYFGFLTDHNSYEGLEQWSVGNDIVAYSRDNEKRPFKAFDGLEITTQYGHYQSLGKVVYYDNNFVNIGKDLKAKEGTTAYDEELKSRITDIANALHASGTIAQINHPYSSRDMGFHYWELVDLYDTIEIWNGVFVPGDGRYENLSAPEQNYLSKVKWFELLNEIINGGKFFAATCGTDNHESSIQYTAKEMDLTTIDNLEEYNEIYNRYCPTNGVPTIYVYCPGELSDMNLLDAIKNGHSFLSNGITVLADVNGATYGQTTKASSAASLNVDIHCEDGLDYLRVVKNGEAVYQKDFRESEKVFKDSVELSGIQAQDWIVLEVTGSGADYAITNPIFFN